MKKSLFLLGLLCIAGIAHVVSQYKLYSLFQLITSVPLILLLVTPPPALLIACTYILLELYSSLPLGSMVILFGIPYGILFIWKKFRVELSWKFFFGVLLIILLQNIAVVCIVALTSQTAGFDIPRFITSMQLLVTAIVTFILSFIYHEYSQRL